MLAAPRAAAAAAAAARAAAGGGGARGREGVHREAGPRDPYPRLGPFGTNQGPAMPMRPQNVVKMMTGRAKECAVMARRGMPRPGCESELQMLRCAEIRPRQWAPSMRSRTRPPKKALSASPTRAGASARHSGWGVGGLCSKPEIISFEQLPQYASFGYGINRTEACVEINSALFK